MRIALSADELTGIAEMLPELIRARGHEPVLHGAYVPEESSDAQEILDAWLAAPASEERDDERNIAHLAEIERED